MKHLSLWPDNFDEAPVAELSPKAILDSAAEELSARTGGHVEGEVHTRGVGDKLEYSFYLRSTDVDYRYLLFKVRHRIDGFPVEIIQPETLQPTEYPDRAAFEDALRELFGRQATRNLVARLRNLEREVG